MQRKHLVILVAVVVVCAAAFLLGGMLLLSTSSSQLAGDALPLYPGAAWNAPQATTFDDTAGTEVISQPISGVTDLAGVFEPFEQYYAQKLAAAGWTVDNTQAAAGPGSEVTVYKKGSEEIVVSYQSLFTVVSAHAPEQCPCDVTMSVFSGTLPAASEPQASPQS
jgi:hypothetical protein